MNNVSFSMFSIYVVACASQNGSQETTQSSPIMIDNEHNFLHWMSLKREIIKGPDESFFGKELGLRSKV